MKTAFLKELGINEQSVIDAIMAENGRDIEKVKADSESIKVEIEGLKAQIAERDSQLKELKKSAGDNEVLTTKLAELEETNKTMKAKYEGELEALRKDSELETKVRDAKAKDVKVVKALINTNEDIDKQIKALMEGEVTGLLFESSKVEQTPPTGTKPSEGVSTQTKSVPATLADAVRSALNSKQ